MEQQLDFKFLNFDRELDELRAAAGNLQNASAECGPALRVYIKALKTLNAEILGSLDPFLRGLRDPQEARQCLHRPRKQPRCQRAGSHSPAANDAVPATPARISKRARPPGYGCCNRFAALNPRRTGGVGHGQCSISKTTDRPWTEYAWPANFTSCPAG